MGLLHVLSYNSHKHISPSTKFVINTPKPTRGGTRCTYSLLLQEFDTQMLDHIEIDQSLVNVSFVEEGRMASETRVCIPYSTTVTSKKNHKYLWGY